MENKAAIAELVEKLNGLEQDRTLGDITTAEYWEQHQAISKQISKLREDQPSNFNSPIPERGNFESPFLKLRDKLLRTYNQAINQIRAEGIHDSYGHRVKGLEGKVSQLYKSALSQVSRARSLQVLKNIQETTTSEVAKAMPFHKAA